MKTRKAALSIRIIYWIININLITLVILTIALTTNIYFSTHFFEKYMEDFASIGLPTRVNFLETGNLFIDNENVKVELINASGRLRIIDSPTFIKKYIVPIRLITSSILFYFLWIFRKFIKNVKAGKTFDLKNISLLKNLAFSLALFGFYQNMIIYFGNLLLFRNLEFDQIFITDNIDSDSLLFLMALFIWVLAHIFITGVKLQQEKDLTI